MFGTWHGSAKLKGRHKRIAGLQIECIVGTRKEWEPPLVWASGHGSHSKILLIQIYQTSLFGKCYTYDFDKIVLEENSYPAHGIQGLMTRGEFICFQSRLLMPLRGHKKPAAGAYEFPRGNQTRTSCGQGILRARLAFYYHIIM